MLLPVAMSKNLQSEVTIAGGGLVGNALAIALGRAGVQVCVVDPLPEETQAAASFDGRTSAIAHASVLILKHIGAWDFIAPEAGPIYDIRVNDQNKPGFVHYHYRDVGDQPFGYIVPNYVLRRGLYKALKQTPNITAIYGQKVVDYSADAHHAHVTLDNGRQVSALLLAAADGRFSTLRDKAGIKSHVIAYGQAALVTSITHEHPHEGLALETFFPEGPFAALPLKDPHQSGIVWTVREEEAADYMQLDEAEFLAAIERRFGGIGSYWGKVQSMGKRFSYPLKLMHAKNFIAKRFVLVGDSAHGIHPIAGQGVNLGYRDVAVLAELIETQRSLGLDVGADGLLQQYARRRKWDSLSMTASTDGLNRLFSNHSEFLGLARRSGLQLVEKAPPLKRFFMRHAMGMVGKRLPKMMQEA